MSWGAREVTKRFGERAALDSVSLEAVAGSVAVVVGGDGAGKTTLLRLLVGALAPDGGTVRRPPPARVGYLSPRSGTYPDLTVEENLIFTATAYGVTVAEAHRRADGYLERTGLADTRDRLAGNLSGGMRQKLGVIQAMLPQPELLVLDEPTTGVDPVSRADLWWLIARAAAEGAAVVVATTYIDEARRAAQVLLLEDGRVAASGTPAAVETSLPETRAAVREPATGTGAALAICKHVTRRFGPLVAVDDVDLAIRAGEVVGLLGANGAGKTTLIRMLLGLLPPSAGKVGLFGRTPSRATRRRIGYVPQTLGLYDDLTAEENLSFSRAAFGTSGDAAVLSWLGDGGSTTVGRLPLGAQRRLAFDVALDHGPDLLVLDEPTSGLDPTVAPALWGVVRGAVGRGAGALVTTHNMAEANECDRVVVMADGKVVADGTVADIVGATRTAVVEADDWARAFEALEAAGMPAALVGATLRVPSGDPDEIRRALGEMHVVIRDEPATLDERFLQLSLQGAPAV